MALTVNFKNKNTIKAIGNANFIQKFCSSHFWWVGGRTSASRDYLFCIYYYYTHFTIDHSTNSVHRTLYYALAHKSSSLALLLF